MATNRGNSDGRPDGGHPCDPLKRFDVSLEATLPELSKEQRDGVDSALRRLWGSISYVLQGGNEARVLVIEK